MARRGLVGGPLRQRRHRRRREVSNPRPGRHRRAGPSGSSAAPVVVRRRPRSRRAFFLTQASGEETWQIFQQIGTLNRLSKNRPYIFFLLKNLLQGREGGKLLQFASFVFHQQIFQQIFASHEPSFGPYKYVEKFVYFLMKNLPRFLPIAKFALKNARLYGEIKRPIEGSKNITLVCRYIH